MTTKKRPAMPGAGRKPRSDARTVICLSIRLSASELASLDAARGGQARAAYARDSLLLRLGPAVPVTPERVVDWLRVAVELADADEAAERAMRLASHLVEVVGEIRRGTP